LFAQLIEILYPSVAKLWTIWRHPVFDGSQGGGAMSWIEIEDNLQSGRVLLALPLMIFGVEFFTAGRALFAIAVGTLGVLHFVYPAFAHDAPMTFPLPGQPVWSYLTGAAFFAAGAAIFMNSRVRLAATMLGILILFFGLIVWVSWLAAHPQDVAGGNYLKDMGLVGGALLLAGALPRKSS
jgi:uncharacterized membrane protein YphA (DoxX/SURF4 family)